jgi:hypothetical protein
LHQRSIQSTSKETTRAVRECRIQGGDRNTLDSSSIGALGQTVTEDALDTRDPLHPADAAR